MLYVDTFRTGGSLSFMKSLCNPLLINNDGSYTNTHKVVCSHQYHVGTMHAMAAVPSGVPIISYRNVAWPSFDDFGTWPANMAWMTHMMHPSAITHSLVADVVTFALQERANEQCVHRHGKGQVKLNETNLHQDLHICRDEGSQQNHLNETILERAWFHHGAGTWSRSLNSLLHRASQHCTPGFSRPGTGPAAIVVGVVTGSMGASQENPHIKPWPAQLENILNRKFNENCFKIQYFAPNCSEHSENVLCLRQEGYAFNSSLDASEMLLRQAQKWILSRTDNQPQPDLVIVELAASDGSVIGSDRIITSATRRLVSAFEMIHEVHSTKSSGAKTPPPPAGAALKQHRAKAPALLYFDSFFKAPSTQVAASHCNRSPQIQKTNTNLTQDPEGWNRATLTSDPYLCASYYYAGTNHDQATVPSGVPVVSYRAAVWPFLAFPPSNAYMAAAGQNQPQDVHDKLAEVIGSALISKSRQIVSCLQTNATRFDSRVGKVTLFRSEELSEGLCLGVLRSVSISSFSLDGPSDLERQSTFSPQQGGWKFYEDRPGKPGWIYESARPVQNAAVISFDMNPDFNFINIGYLRSFGCYGKVQAWIGSPNQDQPFNETCGKVIDSRWDEPDSLARVSSFRVANTCKSPRASKLPMQLNIMPIETFDVVSRNCTTSKFKFDFVAGCTRA